MSQLPPMAALRVFESAGRLEHFSRAAEELGMTQAAVSYQIKHLESLLGQSLFARRAGGVELTKLGKRLHTPISEAFDTMRNAFTEFGEESDHVLTVSSLVSFGSTWLSIAIGRFQIEYPDLAVRLSLANQLVDFNAGGADIGIRVGRGQYEGLRSHFLFRLHLTPVCSPEYAEEHEIREPADLLRVNRINAADPLWDQFFADAGVPYSPSSQSGVIMENQTQEASAVEAGFGVALLTPLFWRTELDSGRLVAPINHIYHSQLSHWLVHPERRVGVRKIERFREWISREIERPIYKVPQEALLPPLSSEEA